MSSAPPDMSLFSAARSLLRGLLASVLCAFCVRALCCWSVRIGIAEISEAACRKRLRTAGAWLEWLLISLLAVRACHMPWIIGKGLRRILLLDGTHLRCPGKQGQVWRRQTAFDLFSGWLAEVLVRCPASAWPLYERQGQRIAVVNWLKSRPVPA